MVRRNFSVLWQSLIVLPALLTLAAALAAQSSLQGQTRMAEPLVLVAGDADAFVAALTNEIAGRNIPPAPDIVVILPAASATAHLVIVHLKAGKKIWMAIPGQMLARVFANMGAPV